MKVGAVSLGWGNVPLPTIFAALSAMGGECVEINGRPERHAGLTLDATTVPEVKQWAADAGLEITAISGYCDFAQADAQARQAEIERLLSSCRVAARMSVPLVRAFVGDVKPGLTFNGVRPYIVEAFQQAAMEANHLGITLAIENHGRLVNDGPQLAALLADVQAPNLGITLDSGNFCWAGHTIAQADADFEALLPHVVNVHIKDGLWKNGNFELVPAGQGEIDISGWLARLATRGYRGPVQSEYEGPGDFAKSTRQSIAFLKTARQQALGRE